MPYTVITIDGPAGAGKSTVSRLVAKRLGFLYLDTGAMYRAVAVQAMRTGIDLQDRKNLKRMCDDMDLRLISNNDSHFVFLGKEDISLDIRKPEIDMLSSGVSAIKEVRESMTMLQRKIAKAGDIVAEGRDMGTVVFPNADYKIFVTASISVRAKRRYKERVERGEPDSIENVEKELRKRDEQDRTRDIAPLRPAEKATLIDTTAMSVENVVNQIVSIVT